MAKKQFYDGSAVAYWKVCNRRNSAVATFHDKIAADNFAKVSGRAYRVLPVWEDDAMYMNLATGSVATYADWWYEMDGRKVNAVDFGEVVPVIKRGLWKWKRV